MWRYHLFILLCFSIQITSAQYQIGLVPRVSPDRSVYQKVGFTEVEVSYGSPAVKNRKVFGGLAPYDDVWRAGANNATTVTFSDSVTIGNITLNSGKYSLFIIPRDNDNWTVIFNKIHQQWGAFKYDEKEDALRMEVSPRKTTSPTENLTYSIEQSGYQNGSIILRWNYTEIEIPFETNYLKKFEQEVETRVRNQPDELKWVVYIQGAEHLENIGLKIELGLAWINQAEQIMNTTEEWNEQFYPRDYVKGHLYWTKAKLLAKTKNYLEAEKYAQKMKNLSNTIFYDRKQKEIDTIL